MKKINAFTISPTEDKLKELKRQSAILDAQRKKLEDEAKKAQEKLDAQRRHQEREESERQNQKAYEELLQELPEEFRSAISYYAYEQGHSGGINEVVNILSELVYTIKEPIAKFQARLTKVGP